MSAILSVRDVHAGYGPVSVLHGISFDVTEGQIVTILGPNGAGKTTTLRAVSGMVAARGRIVLDGDDIQGRSPDAVARLGVAHVPEGRGTFTTMSVVENLRIGGVTRPPDEVRDDLERMFELFPILAQRRDQRAGLLSGGEQQMLAIARALMSRPRVLLLDEPSLGLAPQITARLFELVARLNREERVTAVVVEQNAHLALGIADQAYVLESGRIVMSGPADELAQDPRIAESYLGYAI